VIEIGHLRLRLPAECAGRATDIARLTAEVLADSLPDRVIRLRSLQPAPFRMPAGTSDRQLAGLIAEAIVNRVREVAP